MHVLPEILETGTQLGRYELVMPIAQGGMSEVWLARAKGARGFQQLFAVKALLPVHASNPELVTMFLDEARIASKIRHPNVVGILDLGEQDGVLFLAMEWVEGETVAGLLRRGPVPLPIATRIVLDVCRAAHAAHELRDEDGRPYGLVHRDISPQNILLSPGGAIKLTDFGVLKASFGREIAETLPGRVKGKAAYMAPEQILDSSKLDRRGDVFALGVVLYRLALGEHPFRGRNDVETMTNVVRAALPAELPIERDPALVPLAQILRKALSKKPDGRYASAAEMAEALEALGPAAAPAGPEDVIAYVREAAGAQVRARRKLVLRTLQELDGAPAEGRVSSGLMSAAAFSPSGAGALGAPGLVSSARMAVAPVVITSNAFAPPHEQTPAPMVEIDVAPPSLAYSSRDRSRPRWRERAKGAAFGALALVLGNALLNVTQHRAHGGGGDPGVAAAARPAPSGRLGPARLPVASPSTAPMQAPSHTPPPPLFVRPAPRPRDAAPPGAPAPARAPSRDLSTDGPRTPRASASAAARPSGAFAPAPAGARPSATAGPPAKAPAGGDAPARR